MIRGVQDERRVEFDELIAALRAISERRRMKRTTKLVLVSYAIKWSRARPDTPSAQIIRVCARRVWPTLDQVDMAARVKQITTAYSFPLRRLIHALLDLQTRTAVMQRVFAQDKLLDAERSSRPRSLANARYPLIR